MYSYLISFFKYISLLATSSFWNETLIFNYFLFCFRCLTFLCYILGYWWCIQVLYSIFDKKFKFREFKIELFSPVFFNLFWFTAPFGTEKYLAAPLPGKKWQFVAPYVVKHLKGSKLNIWRHLWHLFTAPLCVAAPRLGITGLVSSNREGNSIKSIWPYKG